jgi:hypothetical protein
MDVKDALMWVEKNCDDKTVKRLRSRDVARTLADEVSRLNELVGYVESLATEAGRQRDNERLAAKQHARLLNCV